MPSPKDLKPPDKEMEMRHSSNIEINPRVIGIAACLFLIFNINIIIFGIKNLNECPIETAIPVYLIVAGSLNMLSDVLVLIGKFKNTFSCMCTFQITWLCWGSGWVYKIYKPNFTEGTDPYCDETVYWFAFWLITLSWMLIALLVFLACCVTCLGLLIGGPKSDEDNRVT